MRYCSICGKAVNTEEAPILAMSGFGNPKYLCDECANDIDVVITDKNPELIENSMSKLSAKLSATGTDDKLVVDTVAAIFTEAGERAAKIKDGTYDFSKDDEEQELVEDVPEELLETETDRALDEADEKKNKRFDSIMNWVSLAIIVVAVGLALFFVIK